MQKSASMSTLFKLRPPSARPSPATRLAEPAKVQAHCLWREASSIEYLLLCSWRSSTNNNSASALPGAVQLPAGAACSMSKAPSGLLTARELVNEALVPADKLSLPSHHVQIAAAGGLSLVQPATDKVVVIDCRWRQTLHFTTMRRPPLRASCCPASCHLPMGLLPMRPPPCQPGSCVTTIPGSRSMPRLCWASSGRCCSG